jgi:transglutaminase-like putative cysteine protease
VIGKRNATETLAPGLLTPLYLFAGLAVVPYVGEQPPGVLLALLAALLWRVAIEHKRVWRPGRWLIVLLGVLTLVLVYRHFHTLAGRDAGLALLIVLLGLKFLEINTVRDAVLCTLLLYIVLAGRFLYDQSLWVGVYAALVVPAGLVSLIHLAHPTGLDRARRWRLAGVLILQAAPLMLVLYFLFPRLQGSLWGLPMSTDTGVTGLSERMQPGSIRKLSESNEIAFRASFEGRLPSPAERYWRELVLWNTDGRAWERGEPAGAAVERVTAEGEGLRYRIVREPGGLPYLPTLDVPTAAPPGVRRRHGLVFEQRDVKHDRYQYDAVSHSQARRTPIGRGERAAALRLSPVLSERVRALALRWRTERGEPNAIAQAAFAHFRTENFVYTLEPPLLGDDPVDEFLFETRRGFCEHYASAFVTLMRAAGVPARVVLGYQGGEPGATGDYLIVRQSDAHAWAEIWDDQTGWRRMDPTAAIAPERVELGSTALRRLVAQGIAPGAGVGEAAMRRALTLGWFDRLTLNGQLYWDYANLAWFRWVADYSPDRQQELAQRLGLGSSSAGRLIAMMALVAGLMVTGYLFWLRRRRLPQDPVQRLYLEYCRKLARAGLRREPHEGALTYNARIVHARPRLAESLDSITALYVDLRYGAHGPDSERTRQLRNKINKLSMDSTIPSERE